MFVCRGKIRNMLLSSDPRRVRQMSDDSINKLERVCRNNPIQSAHQGGFIYPGTKWCGPGKNLCFNKYTDESSLLIFFKCIMITLTE